MDAMASTHQHECERLDQLIRDAALELIRVSSGSVNDTIEGVLQRIVEETHVDRGTLIQASDRHDVVEAAYRWPRAQADQQGVEQDGSKWKWILEQLSIDGRDVLMFDSSANRVPNDVLGTRTSAIAISVAARGRRRYTLALEATRGPREWPQPLVDRVAFLGRMLSEGIHRVQRPYVLHTRPGAVPDDERRRRNRESPATTSGGPLDDIIGTSSSLQSALGRLQRVAPTDSTVLLLGETGTGKELFAKGIHAQSARRQYGLVSVNCAALPPTLIESELFGHERGAFTGAMADRLGRFELADRSTIFLDEIGDLSLEIQVKLLRVLQSGEFERLGSSRTRKVNVRIVAATNRPLDNAVARGEFRADLYYRLSVFPIRLPPLRERREDIPLLVWAYIRKRQPAIGRFITKISPSFMKRLESYSWPGNVRELENIIERALIHSTGDTIDLPDAFDAVVHATEPAESTLSSVERKHIQEVLRECDWRINGSGNAAEQLGLHPNTLRFRMKKLGIIRTRPTPASASLPNVAVRRH